MQKINRKQILILSFVFVAIFIFLHAKVTVDILRNINHTDREIKGVLFQKKLASIHIEILNSMDPGKTGKYRLKTLLERIRLDPAYRRMGIDNFLNINPETVMSSPAEFEHVTGTILEVMQKVFHSSHLAVDSNHDTYFFQYFAAVRIPKLLNALKEDEIFSNSPSKKTIRNYLTNGIKNDEGNVLQNAVEKFLVEINLFNEVYSYEAKSIQKDMVRLANLLASQSGSGDIQRIQTDLTNLQNHLYEKTTRILKKERDFLIFSLVVYFTGFTLLLIILARLVYGYYRSRNKYERLIDAISRSRKILIYEKNPSRIYDELCEFLSTAGYRLVWIGFALNDSEKSILPIAFSGDAAGYMENLPLSWGDSDHGNGPSGRTIKTGTPTVINDVSFNRNFLPWRENAMKHGIKSSAALPLKMKGQTVGVISLYAAHKFAFSSQELDIIQDLIDDLMFNISVLRLRRDRDSARAKLEIQNRHLEDKVAEKTRQIVEIQDATIFSLGALVEARDQETGNHIIRTKEYIRVMLDRMSSHPNFKNYLTPQIIDFIYRSAPLHDIGKIGVPDHILGKPAKLSEEEHKVIRQHTIIGAKSIHSASKSLSDPGFLKIAEEIVRYHHEKWDGTGYPEGLKGDAIPIPARVMAIADIYDALYFKRVYKDAIEHDEVIHIMKDMSGTTFDPVIFNVFLEVSDEFHRIAMKFSDDAA